MPLTRFSRSALSAIFWSQWAYWCALGMAVWACFVLPGGSVRTALILTPVMPGLLIFAVCYWLYQSCDEYIRLRILQAATLTACAVALLCLVYFLLELAGLPKLSMMWVHVVGWSVFNAQMLWLILQAR
jgi:hypothetical protein